MYIRDNGTTVFFATAKKAGMLHVQTELCWVEINTPLPVCQDGFTEIVGFHSSLLLSFSQPSSQFVFENGSEGGHVKITDI